MKKKKIILIKFKVKIIKYYRIYISNLKRYMKLFIITFFKNIKNNEIDLKFKKFTLNKLIIRDLIKRFYMNLNIYIN